MEAVGRKLTVGPAHLPSSRQLADPEGCPYNHDVARFDQPSDPKRFLSVESPAFTPLTTTTNIAGGLKSAGISPKAAAAAIFTPKAPCE